LAWYNGNIGVFTFCAIEFRFENSGIFVGGNHIQISSINMEPYRNWLDFIRLALEMIFLFWISVQATHFMRENWLIAHRFGFSKVFHLWTFVDAANLTLFFIYVTFRIRVLAKIYDNPIHVPRTSFAPVLEEIAAVQSNQLVVNFLNLFIAQLRFFRYYEFQERLKVLNQTFANAFVDLYHFVLMFGVIFGGYAVMGHILFGPAVLQYSSMGHSMQTCWQVWHPTRSGWSVVWVAPFAGAVRFAVTLLGRFEWWQ